MRFETLFTAPEIFIFASKSVEPQDEQGIPNHDMKWICDIPGASQWVDVGGEMLPRYGKIEFLNASLVSSSPGSGIRHEMACWIHFMASIRHAERGLLRYYKPAVHDRSTDCHTFRRSACRFVERSWDFMAPDSIRPLAVTSVGDIGILVQRIGMKWQTFRPECGEMRAEGNGHIIYSTLDRSVGPILHYEHGREPDPLISDKFEMYLVQLRENQLIIPTCQVDMMRFGILPCMDFMGCDRHAIGTIDEVKATLNQLDPTGSASKKVRDNREFEPTATFAFSDLIPMAAPVLRHLGSSIIRIPIPTEHSTGLTSYKEGFVVFRQRLSEYLDQAVDESESNQLGNGSLTDQTCIFTGTLYGNEADTADTQIARKVLHAYDSLKSKYPWWENGIDEDFCAHSFGVPFFDDVQEACRKLTSYFDILRYQPGCDYLYRDLVACHIKHAVNFWHEAHERIREGKARDHHGLCDWLAEGMHLYWDYLPGIIKEMSTKTKAPPSLIREAWIMLMFRAFCWSRCHYICKPEERFPDSTRLPSRYWDSKLPVYLG
ncbi:MAG: hypothetical protein Q9170_003479 [Blastenia crenularia]